MDHAILSASGSSRWINCTPSARLEQQYESSTSSYAEEGTLAHSMGELKLRHQLIGDIGEVEYKDKIAKVYSNCLYKPDMNECTDVYVNYIKDLVDNAEEPYLLMAEQRLKFDTYVPESFGTVDCMLIDPHTLHIIDYKHGQGEFVSVKRNTQLMLYALGALDAWNVLFRPDTVVMHVVQPRKNNIASYTISVKELRDWGENELKPKAKLAWKGEGEMCSGSHCTFCRVKDCKERAKDRLEQAKRVFRKDLNKMTDSELAEAMDTAKEFRKWYDTLEEYIKEQHVKGRKFTALKVVPSVSRTSISDKNQKIFIDSLKKKGYDESKLWKRKELTVTELKALVKADKEAAEMLEKLTSKQAKGFKIITDTQETENLKNIFEK